MTIASFGLAFLAGLLSIFSPCVLPLLPIVLGSAASEHRLGSIALAGGLTASFVALGLFVATIGFAIGLDGDAFRTAAAILMIGVGMVLCVPAFQGRWATAAAPIGRWMGQKIDGIRLRGVTGQFGIGVLIGAVWSPCVGPTLGAASVLAAQGQSLGEVATVMGAYGVGTALPLIAIGRFSRRAWIDKRDRWITCSAAARIGLGLALIAIGAAIVSGLDREIETVLVTVSPQWLTDLTTRF